MPFRVEGEDAFDRFSLENGMAAVEVAAELSNKLELKYSERGDRFQLRELDTSTRASGFRPLEPNTVRIGRRACLIVVKIGHRLTATKNVMREFWASHFKRKVNNFCFIQVNAFSEIHPCFWRWGKTEKDKTVFQMNMGTVIGPALLALRS